VKPGKEKTLGRRWSREVDSWLICFCITWHSATPSMFKCGDYAYTGEPAALMRDVVCGFTCAEGCAETISASVLNMFRNKLQKRLHRITNKNSGRKSFSQFRRYKNKIVFTRKIFKAKSNTNKTPQDNSVFTDVAHKWFERTAIGENYLLPAETMVTWPQPQRMSSADNRQNIAESHLSLETLWKTQGIFMSRCFLRNWSGNLVEL